jgi:tether containing UBX domain for GLUT4
MREAEAAARAAAAGAVAVRAELPGGLVLQAAFPAAAPLAELRALVARALAPAAAAGGFHLFTTPPKAVLRDMSASFYSAGFVPAARVHVGLNDAAVATAVAAGGGAVRLEVLALLGPPPPRGEALRARGAGAGGSGGAGGLGASGSGSEPAARPAGGGAPRRAAGGGSKPKWLKL